jgi:peptide-methionine (R)-S-oxide reductase
LSLAEKQALKELSSNTEIVIKPADKGSAVVIQNRDDYITEGLRQLSDPKFYKQMSEDLTLTHNETVMITIQRLVNKNELAEETGDYLYIKAPRTPKFYMLPKIHKNKLPPPGRPIISANDCPTERISALVDHILRPYVVRITSYVKDTTHFLQILEGTKCTNNDILVTLDVTSLYTNIPNSQGLRAVAKTLSRHRFGEEYPSNQSVLSLLKLVLELNNFEFNDKHYLQVGGTAMGTRVAPSFANIFMSDFEDTHVYTWHLQPTSWYRYIDDIFCIWPHGQETLTEFVDHLNSCHPTIKFTAESSRSSVNFLDVTVNLEQNGAITTTLYTKPTDSHNYLRFESAHPEHCKEHIPYSQFLRIRRICTNLEEFDKHSANIFTHFLRRGYPPEIVILALIRARRQERKTLLSATKDSTKNKNDQNLFLITTFNPMPNTLKQIVSNNWDLMSRSKSTRMLADTNIIFGYRRPKNLKDILVKAKLPNLTDQNKSSRALCTDGKCRYCPRIDTSGKIQSKTTGRHYVTKLNVNCKSNNLIYCISCKICGIQYVGQTKRRLMDRMREHFLTIKKADPYSPIGGHYNTNQHNGIEDVIIHILDFIACPPDSHKGKTLRDKIELNWIHRLSTVLPHGLNSMD